MPKDKRTQIIFVIVIIALLVYFIASYKGEAPKLNIKTDLETPGAAAKPKLYNYTPGTRPDYGMSNDTFKNLPPIPQDFWTFDEKFYQGAITDFVELGEEYYRQPEFYPTFENNLEFIRSPQGSRIYAFGIGAYPGDIGADAFPDSQFTIATFFYSSWVVETHQGVKLEVVYPESADILTPDLQKVDFTVRQDPNKVRQYFNVMMDPDLFVLGSTAPVFDENWAMKVKMNVTINSETPKGTYIIGVNPAVPPPEYSALWEKTYEKYSDMAGFRVGRPTFQLVVFVS